ncbi:MAG: photosystem I reaction center subunit VIII [Xenococcaceae cyanobacterium MO_234.B1]|nr:photosystem I reaction center subunit VIII [Xenococcaceae cyanobacterium MO_234.B1]
MIGDYTASWLPVAMLPFICLVCLAVSMVLFFNYVEGDA